MHVFYISHGIFFRGGLTKYSIDLLLMLHPHSQILDTTMTY